MMYMVEIGIKGLLSKKMAPRYHIIGVLFKFKHYPFTVSSFKEMTVSASGVI